VDRAVKCTAMLADMAEWGAMNQGIRAVHCPPAATALAMGARIELECTALAGRALSARTGSGDGRDSLTSAKQPPAYEE